MSRYDRVRRGNAAKTFPGSVAPESPLPADVPESDAASRATAFPGSPPNAAKTFLGSAPRARFAAARYRTIILEKLDEDLTVCRIWQDLGEEFGYGASYQSTKSSVADAGADAPDSGEE